MQALEQKKMHIRQKAKMNIDRASGNASQAKRGKYIVFVIQPLSRMDALRKLFFLEKDSN